MDWYTQQQQQPLFLDDDEDPDSRQDEFEYASKKEFVVLLIDAGGDMFNTLPGEPAGKSYFEAVMKGLSNHLKARIINQATDEVGICFFNTREKKNIQESEGVYVFSELNIPSAELIRDTAKVHENFDKDIGSKVVRASDSSESILYNALWVAQAMLRTGTSKNVVKRLLIFTNNDDPLEAASPALKESLRRTTVQRAKDAQDLGIGIELFPFDREGEQFNVNILYSDMIQIDDDDSNKFSISAKRRFDDMVDQLTKKMFKKRVVRKISLTITNGIEIGLKTYAMMRPATTGSIIWLDARTNMAVKTERAYVTSDEGSELGVLKRSIEYSGKKVVFNPDELQQVKKTNRTLQLLGFKPLLCLKDYHNLRPPTFLYPDEDTITGSTCAFVAFHRSMLRLQKFAVAFYGASVNPPLVALVAQEEQFDEDDNHRQSQPPGMNLIYLPYSDDIRPAEKYHSDAAKPPERGSRQQIEKAINLMRKLDLADFSVYSIQNPALQKHYAILHSLALEVNDDLDEMTDYTLPNEESMNKPSIMKAVQEFKDSVYGEDYDREMELEAEEKAKGSVASQKRKAAADVASKEANEYNWSDLADSGKLKDLTVVELKFYLTANKLPLSGKKDLLITRILTHLGK